MRIVNLIEQQKYWTWAVPCALRLKNEDPDDSWWVEHWKIIYVLNFDSRIATEKVVCQKKNSAATHSCVQIL